MSENAIGDTKPGAALRYNKRRLSDKILSAFHQACDRGDLEVAERLAGILDIMLARQIWAEDRRHRAIECAVAAHARLWSLKHPNAVEDDVL